MNKQNRILPYWALLISFFIFAGCGGSTNDFVETQNQSGGNLGVVTMNLTAGPVTQDIVAQATTEVYAYNGAIPGPQIEAKVGDVVEVHLTNNLPIVSGV